MSDLRELYQEMILDHYKNPRNFGSLPEPVRTADGRNPLCGDQIRVYVDLDGERVEQVTFEGHGCAISTASASLMSELAAGRPRAEVEALSAAFRASVVSRGGEQPSPEIDLGKLEVLLGVRDYPVRIKCATLAWHALAAAMDSEPGIADETVVSTE